MRSDSVKKIALERIKTLFEQAETTNDLKLSNRYVFLARKLAMKANISMPRVYKRRYCKHCYNYFIPNKTCQVRTTKKKIVSYLCLKCNKRTRIPYHTRTKK
ncbi:ribonuclease P [archaeon]|nr:ribonuclease P [archaeon]